jgi:osmotically-inducible protein OsmY
VYGAISNLGRDKINYVMVQAKGSTVMVGGTVGSDDLKNKILAIAKSSAGIKNVVSELKVQNE